MVILSIITLFPFYFMLVTSFKTKSEFYENIFGFPMNPTLENFAKLIIENNYLKYLMNTLNITVISNLITIVVCILAAYAFAMLKIKGKLFIYSFTISLMAVPAIVVIIPISQMLNKFNLMDTFTGAGLVYSGFMLPFSIYILTNFFRTIPKSVIEASRIDGCNDLMIISRILMPISKPAIITVIILNSLWVWNELIIAMITLPSEEKRTIVVEISTMVSRYSNRPTLQMTSAVFVGLPIMLIYMFANKYFIKGMISGAIK